MTLLKIKISSE